PREAPYVEIEMGRDAKRVVRAAVERQERFPFLRMRGKLARAPLDRRERSAAQCCRVLRLDELNRRRHRRERDERNEQQMSSHDGRHLHHSCRSASTGLSRAARIDGTIVAKNETISAKSAMPVRSSGRVTNGIDDT